MTVYFGSPKRMMLRKILVGLTLFSLGIFAAYLISIFARYSTWAVLQHPFLPVMMMAAITVAAYRPTDHFVKKFLNGYVFRKACFRHMALMELAEELSTELNLKALSNSVVNSFAEVLKLKTVVLLVRRSEDEGWEAVTGAGWPIGALKKTYLEESSPLIRLIYGNGPHTIVRGVTLKSFTWQESNRLAEDFDNLKAGWVMPFFVGQELTGLLAFASESPHKVFDQADFQFFREFSGTVSKWIHNAIAVEKLQQSNLDLQDFQARHFQLGKVTAIEQLASGIAHHIHNPLAIISGKAQVLLMRGRQKALEENDQKALEVMVQQTRRAADITRKLLAFSEKPEGEKKPLDLKEILEETIELLVCQKSWQNIKIRTAYDDVLPVVLGYRADMQEIFIQMLLNGAQAIEDEGEIFVHLSADLKRSYFKITVADNGRGISPEDIEKIFNPFYTSRHGAIGLGLFSVKQVVYRCGGSIRVESRPDGGSFFRIELPCEKIEEMPVVSNQAAERDKIETLRR